MQDKTYIEEFQKAAEITKAESYSLPDDFTLMGKYKAYRNDNTYEALYRLFINHFAETDGTIDLSKVRGQCLNFHFQISDMMKKEFGVNTILTIGYVNYFEKDFFKFEKMDGSLIRKLPDSNDRVIDIHVWLTLPSYEIIDLTFIAHFAFVNSTPEMKVKLRKAIDFPYCFGTAEFLLAQEKIIFHPKFIGDDVLIKNGFLRF